MKFLFSYQLKAYNYFAKKEASYKTALINSSTSLIFFTSELRTEKYVANASNVLFNRHESAYTTYLVC